MSIGSGLAVCGIWAAVAVCAYLIGPWAVPIAILAVLGTLVIAMITALTSP